MRGLENHPDLSFYTYPALPFPNLSNYLLLKVGAPPLTLEDRNLGLFLIDATWRLAQVMEKQVLEQAQNGRFSGPQSLSIPLVERSLPTHYKTAYPRRQPDCPEPELGLASVEALYIAHFILHRSTENLLDHYYWREFFLKNNEFPTS